MSSSVQSLYLNWVCNALHLRMKDLELKRNARLINGIKCSYVEERVPKLEQ